MKFSGLKSLDDVEVEILLPLSTCEFCQDSGCGGRMEEGSNEREMRNKSIIATYQTQCRRCLFTESNDDELETRTLDVNKKIS